jgi:hypothetical protein
MRKDRQSKNGRPRIDGLASIDPMFKAISEKSYQLACLFARLLCCAKGYIARLCAPLRTLQANQNPAQSGNFFCQFA